MESNERDNYSESFNSQSNEALTDNVNSNADINNMSKAAENISAENTNSYQSSYGSQASQPYGYQYNHENSMNDNHTNNETYINNMNSNPYYGASQNAYPYGQNNNQGAFYSSSQHAGYNSQTGYTGATQHSSSYTDMYHSQNGTNQNVAYNESANDMKSRHEEMADKKAEKLINDAKKKAEKKASKENAKREKQARGGNHGKSPVKKAASLVAAAVVFGLVAGTVFQGVRYGSDKFLNKNTTSTESEQVVTKEASTSLVESKATTVSTVYDVADVAEKVMPSIVSITGTYVTTYQYWFNYYEKETPGAGSGIIIGQDDDNLLVLTNYHVVEDAKELSVSFIDGESADATVKGYDSDNDIAIVLVKLDDISDDTMSQIKEITVGSSDTLRVGDPCVAIGNALGYGQSVTVGYVSALNREISVDDGGTITVIQTDAAINPGNSGGALVNMNGELIGVNTAKYVDSEVEGTGYALPISDIQEKINNLISNEDNQSENGNAYLGITAKDITSDYAQGLNMPEGVYVYSVSENSPAEKCGLLTGDIIVGFNGEDVTSSTDLQSLISNSKVGDNVQVEYYRNVNGKYEKYKVTATLEAKDE